MKKLLFTLLLIMIAAQLIVPVAMMVQMRDVINTGSEYKFKTPYFDPYNAFRGRYVNLTVDREAFKYDKTLHYEDGVYYGVLGTDPEGFAYIERIDKDKPASGGYIKGKVKYGSFTLPINRYYMDEKLAPRAEEVLQKDSADAYAKIRVKNGNAVVVGLYINDVPIEDYIK